MADRICSICRESKPVSEFYRNRARADGYRHECKACTAGLVAEKKARDPEFKRRRHAKASENTRRRYYRFYDRALERYGATCWCCGETGWAFLTFGHVNDDGAEDRRRYAHQYHFYKELAEGPMRDDIVVECANCQLAKVRCGRCPHQEV